MDSSTFEVNIRLLGGLLSGAYVCVLFSVVKRRVTPQPLAHTIAEMEYADYNGVCMRSEQCSCALAHCTRTGCLLSLATDLGDRFEELGAARCT